MFEKIIIVTQKSWLDELVEKHNTKEQAKFYIEHMGGSFDKYLDFHRTYYRTLSELKKIIPSKIRFQIVDKSFLPNFLFGNNDLVIVLGRDGLVINTAKYLDTQMLLGVNPYPLRIDGILLAFNISQLRKYLYRILADDFSFSEISIAQAKLNTKQTLIGVNDIFVGHKSHQSARYTIEYNGKYEDQSSSGVVISTGIGSTGWYKSIVTGAYRMISEVDNNHIEINETRFPWNAEYLNFCVREPWKSKHTDNSIIFGRIDRGEKLRIVSNMPEGGTIFSDGIERDKLDFNSGNVVEVSLASKIVRIIDMY